MALTTSSIDAIATELFQKIRLYAQQVNISRLKSAYEFAKMAHHGQLRKSGEPYIIHPLRTAQILTNLHADEDTLIATLLHDVPEDTNVTIAEIEHRFGKKIAYLVDGITKLSKVHYRERMEQRQIESLKKMFIHSAEDLRVILIKLADRLDNMRTLRFIADEKKRMRIARETIEVYVPIANLLGIGEIRADMEDLCFEHLHPVDYTNLKREIEETMEERDFILKEMIRLTEKELQKQKIEAEIMGRPKTLYSIFRKLQMRRTIASIDDLIAIRIIVPTRKDCYEMVGIIHKLFKPKTGRFKDFVALPKPNGYQSLHTTVFGINSSIVEFQIRTRYMHLEAEYGVAAHYFYKYVDEQELASIMRQRSAWVQRILEIQKEQTDPTHFMEDLKLDIFQDRIFIFSPKGDVIDLPRGASALDFAYAIHTDIGNHAVQAEINGVITPIIATLGTGDTIRIITKEDHLPDRESLNFVKTSLAINKIKELLKRQPLDKKRSVGKKFLQKEFDRLGKNFVDELNSKRLALIAQKTAYSNLDDILIAIGEGSLHPQEILHILYEDDQLSTGIKKTSRKHGRLARIGLRIVGDNSHNQFREILRTVNALQIPIVKFLIDTPLHLSGRTRCRISIFIKNYKELAQVFESLEHLEGIEKITRHFTSRKIWFAFSSTITACLWLVHPFLIQFALGRKWYGAVISNVVIYSGLFMLFGLIFYLKRMTRRSIPELAETKYYWPFLYMLTTFALATIIAEMLTFRIQFNVIVVLGLILGVYSLLTASFINYRREQDFYKNP